MADGLIIWISGLSGSGKSTLARGLEEDLLERGFNVETLDADEIRVRCLPTLGCSHSEETGYLKMIGHFCRLLCRNGVITIATAASASRELVEEIRHDSGHFLEIHLKCSEETAEQRKPVGSPSRSELEELARFEDRLASLGKPNEPDILLETDKDSSEDCRERVLRALEMLRFIPEMEFREYNREEDETITRRLKDLGYL
jgi:adenylylsulfate kinase-like enzyme